MADDKVVFEPDGSYQRGGRVEEMDVKGDNTRKRSLSAIATGFAMTVKPSKMTAPTPGTFNLDALRATAVKATSSAQQVPLPEQGTTQFSKVKTVGAPEVKAATSPVEEVSEPKRAPAPAQKAEEPVPSPKAGERKAPLKAEESAPAMEAWSKDKADKLAEEARALLEPTEAPEVTPIDLGVVGVSAGIPDLDVSAEEPVSDPAAPVAEETPPAPVVEEPAAAMSTEFSGNGFRVVLLKDFLKELHIDEYTFAKWCRTCVVRSVTTPATIFSAAFNEGARFYNSFAGKSAQWFGVVVGYGDDIVCIQIQQKSLVMQDDSGRVTSAGQEVKLGGDIVAFYSERLRTTCRV